MQEVVHCKILCKKSYDLSEVKLLQKMILDGYRVHWILDNLPAVTKYYTIAADGEQPESNGHVAHFEKGFMVGFTRNDFMINQQANDLLKSDKQVYLNNHININVLVHRSENDEYNGQRIVGFEVAASSAHHTESSMQCQSNQSPIPQVLATNAEGKMDVLYSYDVTFTPSSIKWASRQDNYLKMTESQIHWFSIVNSCIVVLFLTAMVAMIIIRVLHKDFIRYNRMTDDPEAQQEETGWKLVHADVFRPPRHGNLYAMLIGTGFQISAMAVLTMIFAAFGFLSPANRGGLMTALLMLFVFMSIFAGYFSARTYKMFGLSNWRKNTLLTSMFYPGLNFSVFFILNLFVWREKSSGAVPFGSMFALLFLWFGISVPLVYLGAYQGFKKSNINPITKVNLIPRQIPQQNQYMHSQFSALIGGVLPFGAVFIEIFFIMSSIQLDRFYYMFGFLFIVFIILIITCAEITIVMTYFQLCSEDYEWQQRSYCTSGSSAIYLFLYSILYFFTKLEIVKFVSGLLFFGYMALISIAFFILTGTIGAVATFLFTRNIYGSIKIE